MFDIVSLGEILIDLTQRGVTRLGFPELVANPGGAPANLAVAAARLGASAAFIGKVGHDRFGRLLRETLEKNGVNADELREDPEESTTLAVVTIDENGERDFTFYRHPGADQLLRPDEVIPLPECRVFHFGSVSLTANPSRRATLAACQLARSGGALVTIDLNYRKRLWASREEAAQQAAIAMQFCDVVKLSEEDLELLTGTADPAVGCAALATSPLKLVLVTLGAKGVYYRFGDREGLVPGFEVEVCDTNGAGDSFFGAFLSRLVLRPALLEGLEEAELQEMLRFANCAASITTSIHGAIPAMPTLAQVQARLSE